VATTGTLEALHRALTPMLTLALLAVAPRHGYAIIAELRELGVRGANGGTLYPLLRELEGESLVASSWDTSGAGPARKVFSLTPLGAERLERDRDAVQHFIGQITQLGERGVTP
jgi:PadR family transcriptional regulator, regulatory protein PadR